MSPCLNILQSKKVKKMFYGEKRYGLITHNMGYMGYTWMLDISACLCLESNTMAVVKEGFDPGFLTYMEKETPMPGSCSSFKITVKKKKKNRQSCLETNWKDTERLWNRIFFLKYDFPYTCSSPLSLCSPLSLSLLFREIGQWTTSSCTFCHLPQALCQTNESH